MLKLVLKLFFFTHASYLDVGPLMWMMPLHLHVNKKPDDDDNDDDDDDNYNDDAIYLRFA